MDNSSIVVSDILAQAEAASSLQKHAEAADLYRQLLNRSAGDVDALFGLGTVELQRGESSTAYDLFAQLLAILAEKKAASETLAHVQARLGLAAYQLCDATLALQHWTESETLAHGDEVAQWIAETRPMADVLVSVVLPTYNYAHFLVQTVDSIFSQTHKNLQLIIVNDCSTDNTDEVVQALRTRYRFEYVKNEVNRGHSPTLNIGSKLVRGEYIVAFDADDIMMPEAVASHVANLEATPTATFSYGKMKILLPDGSLTTEAVPEIEGEMFDFILCGNFILPCTVMYRTQAWLRTSGFNEKTTFQDIDLWLKLLHIGPAKSLDMVVAHYRRHGENASGSRNRKQHYRSRMVVLNHWRDEPMFDLAWMHRWHYHDKAMSDEVIETLIVEGDSDPYLHYRYAKMMLARGKLPEVLLHARQAKEGIKLDSYLAPVLYSAYLEALIANSLTSEAMAFCKKHLQHRQNFKTPDFCWAAAEFMLDQCNKSKSDAKALAGAESYYLQCLRTGESPNLYISQRGCGTYLPAMQLGNLHLVFKRYAKAIEYYAKACEYGYLPAFNAYTGARRAAGFLGGGA